jgi:hypothetical protein
MTFLGILLIKNFLNGKGMTNRLLKRTSYGNLFITSSAADGNCFYHSYLQSVEDDVYSKYTEEQKKKRVMVIREYLQQMLTPEDVFYINDSVSFEELKNQIDKFLKDDGKNPPEYLSNDFSLAGYIDFVEKTFPGIDVNKDFVKHVQKITDLYGHQIAAYLRTDGTWMTDVFLPYFSKKMKVDIDFISSTNDKPVELAIRQGFPAVILMYHTGGHFESMGVQTDKEVIRVFTPEAVKLLFGEL